MLRKIQLGRHFFGAHFFKFLLLVSAPSVLREYGVP